MSTNKKEYKVYVIGSSKGYGRWIEGSLTNNMEEADVCVLTGGEDISPTLYGEEVGVNTYLYLKKGETLPARDQMEVEEYKKVIELDIPIWGTCRGAQLLSAMAGGKLIQDMVHYGSHKIYFYDKEYECTSNSLHHQMQYPYNMSKDNYKILAHSHGQSTYYLDGSNKPMHMPEIIYKAGAQRIIKEPEFVYYPKIKGLGIQGHPEMMSDRSDMVQVCHAFLNLLIEKKIDDVLLLNLKVKDIISRAWDFKFTKEEAQLLEQVKEETPIEVD